jgi:arylsulfatase A-like enzyme
MHREIVHVPLVFRGLGLAPRRVPELARQIDVLPTVLDLLHLSAPGELPGRSLAPALRGGTLGGGADFGALAEQDNPNTHLDSWRTQRYRLIRSSADGSRQLFDLQADPLEQHDVAAEQPELVQQLEAELERAKAAGQARARLYGEAREVTLTPGVQDDLRKLGYSGDDAEASGAKAPADRVPRK